MGIGIDFLKASELGTFELDEARKQRKAITPMYSTSRILKTMSENLHFIKLLVIAVLQKEFVVRASFHYPALVHYYDFVRFLHGT